MTKQPMTPEERLGPDRMAALRAAANAPSTDAEQSNVVKIKRKPRPLTKTYQPNAPYVVRREDQSNGSITYEIMDERPETYRIVCSSSDEMGSNPYAKFDAEQIARGLNLLVQYGKEDLPAVRDPFE